ncbi:Acyl transferase domain [Pyrenophora teres f. maculata]|nr:Acyl transferase domain [Pyrenophora teres f. maculata]
MDSQKLSLEPIAIIGSGCRFPGSSSSPSKLWKLLSQPCDVSREVPRDRFNVDNFFHADPGHHGTGNVRVSYFLDEDVSKFDAPFFNIKQAEASTMDPQHRLLLETVYEAVESAGLDMNRLRGTDTAVYCGVMCGDYEHLLVRDIDYLAQYHATGIGRSLMSNRISYFFDWKGPSITIDTACSSSLIAVHEAVQVLRSGRCRVAVASGSNLLLGPENYIAESSLNMLSPDGRGRMWDINANGYARGEGVAAIVMKTLSHALADGDAIECLIRNTGVNQDGRTSGITMPSFTSQTSLIRSTYREVGLDPIIDRPQYFEAHGTGTPAGDPVEARAIRDAFFGGNMEGPKGKLYVGSIKTVIGHSEGTAGLAALLKASLCLQNGKIAPNLLFEKLSPSVAPFYGNLEVPTTLKDWPELDNQTPRRASVNSFGFGGSNAHAILEAYRPPSMTPVQADHIQGGNTPCLPIVLSARSPDSLKQLSLSYIKYLVANPSTNISDLSRTLSSCRTRHSSRTAYAAANAMGLADEMRRKQGVDSEVFKSNGDNGGQCPRILGIFTGQGAQWAGMGRELVTKSAVARQIIRNLDLRLAQLPESDRPSWTLLSELLADEAASRISQAAFSQPMCAAIQIVLVDMMLAAKVRFTSVVGHSSGEIGAAYAAGAISAGDAITIAYYRGLHSKHAQGPDGQIGAMLAIKASLNQAEQLISDYNEQVSIAACNSSSSITLSGSQDAILSIKSRLEDEGTFSRLLVVDKAYHSNHMRPCYEPYSKALAEHVFVSEKPEAVHCLWYSSVYPGELGTESMANVGRGTYWVENMVQPVLFSQALEVATAACGQFDLAIEVGPHPALRTPALKTLGKDVAYFGTLKRGEDAFYAISNSLGAIWSRFDSAVDLAGFIDAVSPVQNFTPIKQLPSYAWDHKTSYWHESRRSRIMRLEGSYCHELLGRLSPEITTRQMSWRNFLRQSEIPWLDGHRLQGQTVFPAAGYIVLAIESGRAAAHHQGKRIRLVEVEDMTIRQAMTISDRHEVEILTSLTEIEHTTSSLSAKFSLFLAYPEKIGPMVLVADGCIKAALEDANLTGPETADLLLQPSIVNQGKLMSAVDTSDFYDYLDSLGYDYSGPFRILQNLERCLGSARGTLNMTGGSCHKSAVPLQGYIVHPALLDCAFQTAMLAFSAPYDGQLWSLHVPTSIFRVTVDVDAVGKSSSFEILAELGEKDECRSEAPICGDIDLVLASTGHVALQVEEIHCVPFARSTATEDKLLFSETVWDVATPDVSKIVFDGHPSQHDHDLAIVAERACYYYLRLLDTEIPSDHPARSSGPYVGMFNYTRYVLNQVAADEHPHVTKAWDLDEWPDIERICEPYKHTVDIRMIHAAGKNFRNVILGKTTILEHMRVDGLLDRYYEEALAFPPYNTYIGRAVAQLSHRFPKMNILEIGAGTGSASKTILKHLSGAYKSYTFTDISSGFFPTAVETFAEHQSKMDFRVLDIGKSPKEQGFVEGSYDLLVASFVLHATEKLEETMSHARKLLRPGGYIMMLEVTNNEPIREGSVFGCLPGWWLGIEDGRIHSPCISVAQWDQLLCKTGFGGVDHVTPNLDTLAHPVSLIISQAVDDRVQCLRQPLAPPSHVSSPMSNHELLVIGGSTSVAAELVADVLSLLRDRHQGTVTIKKTLKAVSESDINHNTICLCLVDIEDAVFHQLDEECWGALKLLFEQCKAILWVTTGRLDNNPHANISLGFARTQLLEAINLICQFVDLDAITASTPRHLAELLMQLAFFKQWNDDETLKSSEMVWTMEQEVIIHDETLSVPRLKHSSLLNNRYNSTRRSIINEEELLTTYLMPPTIREGLRFSVLSNDESSANNCSTEEQRVTVHTEFAVMSPLRLTKAGPPLFILTGRIDNGTEVLALAPTVTSFLQLRSSSMIPLGLPATQISSMIQSVAFGLVAGSIVLRLQSGQSILVYGADPGLAAALSFFASQRRVSVAFVGPKGPELLHDGADGWIQIPSNATSKLIRQLIPTSVSSFVDFSRHASPDRFATRLVSSLDPHTVSFVSPFVLSSSDVSLAANDISSHGSNDLVALLQGALHYATLSGSKIPCAQPVVSVSELQARNDLSGRDPLTVIDWRSDSEKVCVPVVPAQSHIKFHSNRTYWLLGLTGSLGTSLCQWMVSKGARNLVLSSRNPKLDGQWLNKLSGCGANVVVKACDVTSKQSIVDVYQEIRTQMPPIAGVTQGAMVLDDSVIQNMSYSKLMTVLRPKVDGSINLEEVLAGSKLDFLVFFSSGAFVTGRMGQANYTAANAYMVSAARTRRKRGLAASVLHLGPVVGVGYVERIDRTAVREGLVKTGYNFMSETDFHTAFAEAVLASPPDSRLDMEVTTCVRVFAHEDAEKPVWANNPRMSHLAIQREAISQNRDMESNNSLSSRVLESSTREELHLVIQDAFVNELRGSLHLTLDGDSMGTICLDTAGIDSLIAVEIRAWFSKNLATNIPVLKILEGLTISEIVEIAIQGMPSIMLPKLQNFRTQGDDTFPSSLETVPLENHKDVDFVSKSEVGTAPATAELGCESPTISSKSQRIIEETQGEGQELEEVSQELPTIPSRVAGRSEPLFYGQSMFWFVQQLLDDPTTLNHTALCRIQGSLRIEDLRRAIKIVAKAHETLRTCFLQEKGDEPHQVILEVPQMTMQIGEIQSESEAWGSLKETMGHVYHLEKGETMLIKLLTLSGHAETNFLLVGSHHINFDGFSSVVLLRHLQLVYSGQSLPGHILQYSEHGRRQLQEYADGKLERKLSFWKSQFQRLPSELPLLPMARTVLRCPLTKYSCHRRDIRLDSRTCLSIYAMCRRIGCTPFHFYLATFRLLLVKLCGALDDLCIGISEANRYNDETMECLGPLMGLLPVLFRSGKSSTRFEDLLTDTKDAALSALSHGGIPFEILLKELDVPRSGSHSPLFQAFLDYRMGTKEKMEFSDCEMELLRLEPGRVAYDVSLDIIDNGRSGSGDCLISVMVQTSLYDEAAADLLCSSYRHLVDQLSKKPSLNTDAVQLYPESEIDRALDLGNGKVITSAWNSSLLKRFTWVWETYADKTAIKDGYGTTLSYREFEMRVASIAETLVPLIQSPGVLVGVYQEPSANWVCSMVAIMLVGAVYVPLDMGTPLVRLVQIVQDCKMRVLLASSNTAQVAGTHLVPMSQVSNLLVVDNIVQATQPNQFDHGLSTLGQVHKDSPCAILHTSGSTGVAKGIILSHENIANEAEQSSVTFGFGPDDVVLQQSALSFDMSLTQILSAIAYGGMLCMVPLSLRGDAVGISDVMVNEGVTFTGATPSEYTAWLTYGNLSQCQWRIAVSGGEPVSPSLLALFSARGNPGLRVFNAYGPTEVTCSATRMELNIQDYRNLPSTEYCISAGNPAPNVVVRVVNDGPTGLEPLPIGLPGEIVVGGAGIAHGYLNPGGLTEDRFIEALWVPDGYIAHGWTRMHRTGDFGRWLPDGTLLVEGRANDDTQVKVAGVRIDMRTIESTILESSQGSIVEALVSLRSTASSNGHDDLHEFLVGHVVLKPNSCLDLEHFRTVVLAPRLSPRSLPTVLIAVDRLPKQSSGKIDRCAAKGLPLDDVIGKAEHNGLAGNRYDTGECLSPCELEVLQLWKEVVPGFVASTSHVRVTSSTDFFHFGGTSLLLIQLQARIQQTYGVDIRLIELFECSTLEKMSLRIHQNLPGHPGNATIDWNSETDVPHEWTQDLQIKKKSDRNALRLVLTGASGFLGMQLLQSLVVRQDVQHVYCIAVRNPNKLAQLIQSPKISVFSGDLVRRRLGLSLADAAVIFSEADAVLHNGCEVSHMRSYTSLRPSNYDSTREIVRLALSHRIPVHYVSSAGIGVYSGHASFPSASASPYPPPSNTGATSVDGYNACKWASERFLEKTCELVSDFKATIYRPTSILRGNDAVDLESIILACKDIWDNNPTSPAPDLWQELFHFSLKLRAVPTSFAIQGVVNFVSTSTVVNGILATLLQSDPEYEDRGPRIRYINFAGPTNMPLDGWQEAIKKHIGEDIATLPINEWAVQAEQAGMKPMLAQFFATGRHMDGLVFPRVLCP